MSRDRESLVRFLEDGRIALETNSGERAIGPICLSRNNALFASLAQTCKLNDVG
jgi:transposase